MRKIKDSVCRQCLNEKVICKCPKPLADSAAREVQPESMGPHDFRMKQVYDKIAQLQAALDASTERNQILHADIKDLHELADAKERELAEASAERIRFKDLYEDYSEEVQELQLERNNERTRSAKLVSALEFYADIDGENWAACQPTDIADTCCHMIGETRGGDTAAKALVDYKGRK